jgi:hypothetical protein
MIAAVMYTTLVNHHRPRYGLIEVQFKIRPQLVFLYFLCIKSSLLLSSSSNGLPFEHLAHEEFSWPQSVAHFA